MNMKMLRKVFIVKGNAIQLLQKELMTLFKLSYFIKRIYTLHCDAWNTLCNVTVLKDISSGDRI